LLTKPEFVSGFCFSFGGFLFDANQYFDLVQQTIATCDGYSNVTGRGVKIEPDGENWNRITWLNDIEFTSGHSLRILEFHKRDGKQHLRKVKYHLMDADRRCLLRVDNHEQAVPFDDPCHIHLGNQQFDEGDPRLRGISLCGIGFPEVFSWVHKILDGTPLPWEE
jgi:hypothetical protein